MAVYFIQDTTLTKIADKIRAKLGISISMSPEVMPNYIDSISTTSSDAPEYIQTEVNNIITQVNKLQNDNTITLLATSDIHYSNTIANMDNMLIDLNYAINLLREKLTFAFEGDMGDKVWGNSKDTTENTNQEAIYVNSKLGYSPIRFSCCGNHDTYRTSINQRYAFTSYQNYGSSYGNELRGYCYRDLDNKKIRVILLNTSELDDNAYSSTMTISNAQLQWLCETIQDTALNKPDYHILFMSHMPPDWGVLTAEPTILKVIKAINNKSTYTINNTTYDFSTLQNPIIGWCHGHVHNHVVKYITGTSIYRFCIPSAWHGRANEYSRTAENEGNTAFLDIFGEQNFGPSSYAFNTANSTTLSIIVINTLEQQVNIINYGAGGSTYNRSFSYKEIEYTQVDNQLTNASTNNTSVTTIKGQSYRATITPISSEYEINSIAVYVDGVLNNDYVSGNTIYIENVTGDVITIVAIATKVITYNVNNLVRQAQVYDNESIYGIDYNEDGKADGFIPNRRISQEAGDDYSYSASYTGFVATGWIPYQFKSNYALYIRGGSFDFGNITTNNNAQYSRIYAYNSKVGPTGHGYISGSNILNYYNIEYPEGENVNYYKLTLKDEHIDTYANINYIRISLMCPSGKNLIVTDNEPIVAENAHKIQYALNNATSTVNTTAIVEGESYSTTIAPKDNYIIDTIKVFMNGQDITNSAVQNNTITISQVTGNIGIIVTTIAAEINNLVRTAIADSTGTIFNTYGYQNGKYLSSSGVNKFSNDTTSPCVATGSILIGNTTTDIYVKGAKWDTANNHVRFSIGSEIGGISYNLYADGSGSDNVSNLLTVTVLNEEDLYYKFTLTESGKTYLRNKYYRISLVGTGENLIITHDQPITADTITYSIQNELTNITTNNNITTISNKDPYEAQLTPVSGRTIDSVIITMSGIDVTNEYYNNGNINIPEVIGDIIIIATATEEEVNTYTNLVPTSLDYDLNGVFNDIGYKNGYYVTTDSPYYKADSSNVGCTAMGVIPYDTTINNGYSTPPTIYIKGVTFDTSNSRNRIGLYQSEASKIYATWNVANTTSFNKYFTIETLGTQYYKITPVMDSNGKNAIYNTYASRITHISISATGDGANMIVTLDEPIE